MKAGALLILLAGITMPLFAVAQTADEARPSPPKAESQNPKPAAGVYIVKYSAVNKDKDEYHEGETSGSGPLHIIYRDGTDVVVPNEKSDFSGTQDSFRRIHLAKDHQTIGWLADYMMCAQSYACPRQLVIYRSGHVLQKIGPSYGTLRDWQFSEEGKQVVTQESSFPYGYGYALYDIETGHKLAEYSLRQNAPKWVQFAVAQTADETRPSPPKAESQNPKPAAGVYIVKYSAVNKDKDEYADKGETSGSGPLHLIYSDGTDVVVPNEKGDFARGYFGGNFKGNKGEAIAQGDFKAIHLAEDHQTIGWLAGYMMCEQNYPCDLELVIYRSGHVLQKISPAYGVLWDWQFSEGGKQVVTESGFPHGDVSGAYELIDVETGHKLAEYSFSQNAPKWAQLDDRGRLLPAGSAGLQ